MRITTKLQDIAVKAAVLRQQRGDTDWNDEERAQIDAVYELMESLPVHSADPWSKRRAQQMHPSNGGEEI